LRCWQNDQALGWNLRLCSVGSQSCHRRLAVTGAAAPAAGAVVADCSQTDVTSDEALLAPDLFCPGILNIGTFEGGAILAVPQPLLLHNTGTNFPSYSLRTAYRAVGASQKLRVVAARLPEEELVKWVSQSNP